MDRPHHTYKLKISSLNVGTMRIEKLCEQKKYEKGAKKVVKTKIVLTKKDVKKISKNKNCVNKNGAKKGVKKIVWEEYKKNQE